jgi:hypothetical protein
MKETTLNLLKNMKRDKNNLPATPQKVAGGRVKQFQGWRNS